MNPPINEFAGIFGKKAFEISYATLRVAGQCGNAAFASYLDSYGMMVLDSVTRGDIAGSKKALDCIRQFMILGAGSGLILQKDADLLANAAKELTSAIDGMNTAILPDLKLEEVLTSDRPSVQRQRVEKSTHSSSLATDERQKQIVDRIRQSGNCRIKDLQEYFPGISERTLRYDLQNLLALGAIERLGNGGPSVSYRIRAAEEPVVAEPIGASTSLLPPTTTV